ncbi:MAG: type I methionyl aminopeptidase [Planctomycetes bacterium]|nr:type I methionyl aminopeptidase [Planctomycetota bacterium]
MREAGRAVAGALDLAETLVKPGITTGEIDAAIAAYFQERGCQPLFKGYKGYPATICASVNEEIVHGIPGPRVLKEGDIIGIDLGAKWKGYCGDAARTYAVGAIAPKAARLVHAARESLDLAIRLVGPGVRLTQIGGAIQQYAESLGYSVVRQFTGHGIGTAMHEDPQVPNYVDSTTRRSDVVLKPGMVIAIEPMLNEGTYETETLKDRWTVVTRDRKLSAHFEHTVAVTTDGRDVLTKR